jgi:hypothetical protein
LTFGSGGVASIRRSVSSITRFASCGVRFSSAIIYLYARGVFMSINLKVTPEMVRQLAIVIRGEREMSNFDAECIAEDVVAHLVSQASGGETDSQGRGSDRTHA